MNLKTAFAVLAAAALEAKDQYDIRPGESSSAALTAVEWQATNATKLAAATAPEALAAHEHQRYTSDRRPKRMGKQKRYKTRMGNC